MELGILTLGDLQRDPSTRRPHRAADRMADRMADILGYAALAGQLGTRSLERTASSSPSFSANSAS